LAIPPQSLTGFWLSAGSRPRPHAGPEEAGVKNPFSVELAIPIGYNVGGYDVGFICNTYFN